MSARKHKSSQDFKTARIANAVKKLGGKEQADQTLAQWLLHRQAEKNKRSVEKN